MKISYARLEDTRARVVSQLMTHRARGPYRVIDLGGEGSGWSREVIDSLVDIRGEDPVYTFDLCSAAAWEPLLDLVDREGRFDYAICTHTMEDLFNPCCLLDNLPKIARAGVLTTPSIRTELARHENGGWLGNIHHRWLVDQEDGQLLLAPKLGFLELFKGCEVNPLSYEIVFDWEHSLPWKIMCDNYFESSEQMVDSYNALIVRASTL